MLFYPVSIVSRCFMFITLYPHFVPVDFSNAVIRYGHVNTDNIKDLFEQHIIHKKVVYELWRGRMGSSSEETEKIIQQNMPQEQQQQPQK